MKSVAGKPVPFNPRHVAEPNVTRLSRRIGLRTIPSIGAKGCPSGEQVVNGGFETGDFTGWTKTGNANRWEVGTVGTDFGLVVGACSSPVTPEEGSYMAFFHSISTDPMPPKTITGTLQQLFATPIPVACFTDASFFSIQTNWQGSGCPPEGLVVWQIEILYTDGTSTIVDISGDPPCSWEDHDLKSVLETGKTVKGIKITATIFGWAFPRPYTEVYIDACTLKCFI